MVVKNLLAVMSGRDPSSSYAGYGACPLINTMKERYDMWLLKRYGLAWFYWSLMLRGRV